MRACVQRVSQASVTVEGEIIGEIKTGFLVLLGVGKNDTLEDVDYMANKILGLRVFEDAADKMNLDLKTVNGEMLVVSQFTLYGDCRKGRRPSFIEAASPELGNQLYEAFVARIKQAGIKVETGRFRADMDVELVNDGPVTLLLDSEKVF